MSAASRVFITQQNLARDPSTGAWTPKFDISPAQQYGKLEYIFGAGQIALMAEATADAITSRLDELGYDPVEDYLLITGDPVIGAQAAVLMMARGGCRILRWDKRYRGYHVYKTEHGATNNER